MDFKKKCFMPLYIVYIYSGINENVFYAVQANDRKQPINRHWNIETFNLGLMRTCTFEFPKKNCTKMMGCFFLSFELLYE